MRFTWVLCLVLGLAFLAAAGVCGVLAVRQATEISAYHHSRVCMAGAPLDEDCLQPVDGAVSAVVEVSGKSPEYALDVQTATGTLHTSFTSDSPMLGYAIDGDPVVVTVWRGIPVSVSADGRTEATATVPATAFAKYLGEWGQFAGAGVFLVLGGAAARRRRLAGPQPVTTSPAVTAGLLALGLGSAVVMVGGFLLAGKPSRLGPDLAVTGAALVVIAGLSGWLGVSVRRRNGSRPAASAVRRQRLPKVARMRMALTE